MEPQRVPLVEQEGKDHGMAGLQGGGWQAEEEEEEGRWVEVRWVEAGWVEVRGWAGEGLVQVEGDVEELREE